MEKRNQGRAKLFILPRSNTWWPQAVQLRIAVPDHRADPAEVHGVVGLGVEERRLQDRGREDDLVGAGVVIGVDRLRGHVPLGLVDRPAHLGELEGGLEAAGCAGAGDQVAGHDLEAVVRAPLLGVADLRGELLELGEGLLAGGRGHPGQVPDGVAVGVHQCVDQHGHALLVGGREVTGDVFAAHREADDALDQGDPALPPLAQLLGAREDLSGEGEVLLDQGGGAV